MAKDITTGNISKTFLIMGVPLILSSLLTKAYNLIDLVLVGQFLDDLSIAALGSSASLTTLLSAMCWGFATGASICIAQLFGARKYKEVKSSFLTHALSIFTLGFIIMLVCVLFKKQIYVFLRIDDSILQEADIYFTIITLSLPFRAVQSYTTYCFHSIGTTTTPLIISISSTIIHIIVNILLMLYGSMGIGGLALTSGIFSFISALIAFVILYQTFNKLDSSKPALKFTYIKEATRYGFPCMLQQSALYFSSTIVQPLINGISPEATAGYTVALKMSSIAICVFEASSKCVSTYTAQCVGSKQFNKIKKCLLPGLLQNVLLCLPFVLMLVLFPNFFCGLFLKDKTTGALNVALLYIPICMPFIFFQLYKNLLHNFLRGVGAVKLVLLCTVVYAIAHIGFSYLLIDYQMAGIYWAINIAYVLESAVIFILYLSGVWKPKQYKIFEAQQNS